MATATEETVRQEQEEWEAENDGSGSATSDEEAKSEGELFDKSIYEREELQLPKVDGEGVDKIAVAFSGTVLLDRGNPADVELMRRMRLGGDVTLMVEAKCSGKGHKFTTDREGELDVIVLEHKAKVHTVYKPAAAELEDAA